MNITKSISSAGSHFQRNAYQYNIYMKPLHDLNNVAFFALFQVGQLVLWEKYVWLLNKG